MQASQHERMLAMIGDDSKPKGRAVGGLARAKSLTSEQRSEIARKAANAKHAISRQFEATHKGNFIEQFGVDVECYVLNDVSKTAVLTQRGMSAALGAANPGGNDFVRFAGRQNISKYLGVEAASKISQPIEFKSLSRGAVEYVKGYSADVLIDVCNAVLNADAAGELKKNQANFAKQARILLNASAKSGITNLVYALSGFRPTEQAVIDAFRAFVQAEAKKYEKEFPAELYLEWARLYDLRVGRSWKNMHLTIDHIYTPLAKSNGKLLTLVREAKSINGDRNAKLFQFLNEIGTRSLRIHLGRVLEMAESSKDQATYESKIEARFGNGQLSLL
jgi:hypothetical protein